jgi:DNA mismatch endonuclease, patch repair protein
MTPGTAGATRKSRLDPLLPKQRSALMAKVRSTGNRSTEVAVEKVLRTQGIRGWRKHPKQIHGTPDFFFPGAKLAIFVNGCFWHGCERCSRNVPRNRRAFWVEKIRQNRRRDLRVLRQLCRSGFRTMTIWEHSVSDERWFARLLNMLGRE